MQERLAIRPHIRSMIDTDGAVLLDLKAGKYYSLNPLGTRIWSRLEEGCSVPEILEHLEESFPTPPERLRADLTAFVQRLKDMELVNVDA